MSYLFKSMNPRVIGSQGPRRAASIAQGFERAGAAALIFPAYVSWYLEKVPPGFCCCKSKK